MANINFGNRVQPISIEVRNSLACCCSVNREVDKNLWYYDIKKFIQHRKYPSGASNIDMKTLQRLAIDYYLNAEVLYKRFRWNIVEMFWWDKSKKVLQEVHEGICATHTSGYMTTKKIQRSGYFFMTMEMDSIEYVRKMP
jgi:hypothetical protein